MIIPYRVKNPWKNFPYAVIAIIALNVLVYLLTTIYFLSIRSDVVANYAFRMGSSPIFNIITAMFLHANLFHILGNMLILWVFGPSVEDRLGIPRFLALYFLTGIAGSLLEGLIEITMVGQAMPGIGASGCIMGVMGAYWYLYAWSPVCIFYWWFIVIRGTFEAAAFWVIGCYLLYDVIMGYWAGPASGVGHFAHIGGGAIGILFCALLRIRRDSAKLSQVKALQAEVKDISLLTLPELEIMRKAEPDNSKVIRAMLQPSVAAGKTELLHTAFREAGSSLIEKDPVLVMQYLFRLQGDHTIYHPNTIMRVAAQAENSSDPQQAMVLYEIVRQHYPNTPNHEMALYRMARFSWQHLHDAAKARVYLRELLQMYPIGNMEQHAQLLLQQMGR